MSTAEILVSIAGPGMNLVLAIVLAIVHTILVAQGVLSTGSDIHRVLYYAVVTNFVLMFFNLLRSAARWWARREQFMPYKHRAKFDEYARFGPFIVMAFALILRSLRCLFGRHFGVRVTCTSCSSRS